MKLLLAFLLCLLSCFSVQAQQKQQQKHRRYVATKGDRVEYDTAIVVNVTAYRDDIRLLKHKDYVIDSLKLDLDSLYAARNQQTIMAEQQGNGNGLQQGTPEARVAPKKKWYMNPIFGLGAGLLIGIYLIPDNSL